MIGVAMICVAAGLLVDASFPAIAAGTVLFGLVVSLMA
jgi:hypothetical protein